MVLQRCHGDEGRVLQRCHGEEGRVLHFSTADAVLSNIKARTGDMVVTAHQALEHLPQKHTTQEHQTEEHSKVPSSPICTVCYLHIHMQVK